MNGIATKSTVGISIGAVERDTGLSKDTLRVWERRYGFPRPTRDAFGERVYSLDQIDKLRILKRVIDLGHRPGVVVAQSVEQLQLLAGARPDSAARGKLLLESHQDLASYVELLKAQDVDGLRRRLSQVVLRVGLERFVTDVLAPLNGVVGDAWTRGDLEIFEEHLYTESINVIMRNAINSIPGGSGSPRVLLTTFPQEPHGIGLLMAEAILALDGCRCICLGVQTPVRDIVQASAAQRADVVALSFSACLNPKQVIDGLAELRGQLPAMVEIWAGGSCPVLYRRPPRNARTLRGLADITPAVADWRAARRVR